MTVTKKRTTHHHAALVLAVFSRYKLDYYTDRQTHPTKIGVAINTWADTDLALAIEEGRRQMDAQYAQLQFITSRASTLLPLAVATSIFFLTTLDDLADLTQPSRFIANTLLATGALLTIWGAAIMGAIIGGRANTRITDTTKLTEQPAPLDKYLARDYAENVATGYDTNAARLTHLGTGITWIVAGIIIGAIGLAFAQWAPNSVAAAVEATPSGLSP